MKTFWKLLGAMFFARAVVHGRPAQYLARRSLRRMARRIR